MAKLPDATALGERPAPVPWSRGERLAEIDTRPQAQANIALGESMQEMGNAIYKVQDTMDKARKASQLSDTLLQANLELGTAAKQFERDPDFATAPQRFQQVAKDIGNKYVGQFTDPESQAVFKNQFNHSTLSNSLHIVSSAAKLEADTSVASLVTELDEVAKQAATAATPVERDRLLNTGRLGIVGKLRAGFITPIQARDLEHKLEVTTDHSMVSRDIEVNPVATRDLLRSDRNYGKYLDDIARQKYYREANAAAMLVEANAGGNAALDAARGVISKIQVPVTGGDAQTGSSRIAQAIFNQESGGGTADTSRVNAQGVLGPMQIKDTTWQQYQAMGVIPKDLKWNVPADNKKGGEALVDYYYKKYAGDETKVAAAYYGGEGAINADGSINRQWRNLQRSSDPTVGQYVDQVLARVSASPQAVGANYIPEAPNSRDVKAMLPIALAEVPRMVAEKYPDRNSQDAIKYEQLLISTIKGGVSRDVAQMDAIEKQAHATLSKLMTPDNQQVPLTQYDLVSTPEGKRAWSLIQPDARQGYLGQLSRNQAAALGNPAKANAAIVLELGARIHLPPSDPKAITNANQLIPFMSPAFGLTIEGKRSLETELEQRLTPDGRRLSDVRKNALDALKPRFDSSTLTFRDPVGPEDFLKFSEWAREQEKKTDKPYELYDTTNKNYIGKSIGQFERNLDQKIDFMLKSITPVINPKTKKALTSADRLPNESWPDMKLRLGIK